MNSAAPRHALNTFAFQIPSTLPTNGTPGALINESHSFGQLLSGCVYDTIRNIFKAMPQQGEQDLLSSAQVAARVLLSGVRSAPLVPRFFESVGHSMIAADLQLNGGANQAAIQSAFGGHSITLGSTVALTPKADLQGAGPILTGKTANALDLVTRKDLLRRIGAAPNAKLAVDAREVLGQKLARAVHKREVPLTGLDKRLAGVVAPAEEPMFVGLSGKPAVLMGSLPEAYTTNDEVRSYVQSLLQHDRIAFETQAQLAIATSDSPGNNSTHVIRVRKGKKVLVRIRFFCR